VKKVIQFLIFLGLGCTIMWLVYRSQNAAFQAQCQLDGIPSDQCSLTDALITDFSSVRVGWLVAVIVAFTMSNAFRTWRWQMLLAPMGYNDTRFANGFWSIILGYFANLGLPRMGEVVRVGAFARNEDIPAEKVMGTLVVDRLMDVVCLGLVVGLAFIFEGDTLWAFIATYQNNGAASGSSGLGRWLWILGGAMLASGVLTAIFWSRLSQIGLIQRIMGRAKGFLDGLRSIFRLERPWLFIAYSLGIWLMFYLQCYFNLQAFAPTAHLTLGAALMVFVFGTLGFVIPSPGGMGTYHLLCIGGLALYGISGRHAFSYANIAFFTVQIFYNIIAGLLALFLLPRYKRSRT
jgi:glycosyltransferase 2 family protein